MKKFFYRIGTLSAFYGTIFGLIHITYSTGAGIWYSEPKYFAVTIIYSLLTFFFFNCLSWLGHGNIFEPKALLGNAMKFYIDSWKLEKRK